MASPYARKLAKERGLDISDARPTGTNNRVVAADIEELDKSGGAPICRLRHIAFISNGVPLGLCI